MGRRTDHARPVLPRGGVVGTDRGNSGPYLGTQRRNLSTRGVDALKHLKKDIVNEIAFLNAAVVEAGRAVTLLPSRASIRTSRASSGVLAEALSQ
jgi:hypothetical protein